MKVAIIHDYLNSWGGAEEVLSNLHEIWSEAPIYTIFRRKNSPAGKGFVGVKVIQSWFGYLPFADRLISPLRFLIPLVWRSFDLSQYDLIITSASWAITKGLAKDKTKEICYCHTPPRSLYGYETSRKQNWLVKIYGLIVGHFLRQYDFRQAQKVDWFIANSREVQKRIKKFYRRESTVIYPPVNIGNAIQNKEHKEYFLAGGRLERSKNFDLIIKACNQLKLPLKIYGTGYQERYLRQIAGPTVEILSAVSKEKKWQLLAGAKAFICVAKDEDFGITPVEAMATGTPVIAFNGGGFKETVINNKTGILIDDTNVETIEKAIRRLESISWSRSVLQSQTRKFSKERFVGEIKQFVKSKIRMKR